MNFLSQLDKPEVCSNSGHTNPRFSGRPYLPKQDTYVLSDLIRCPVLENWYQHCPTYPDEPIYLCQKTTCQTLQAIAAKGVNAKLAKSFDTRLFIG